MTSGGFPNQQRNSRRRRLVFSALEVLTAVAEPPSCALDRQDRLSIDRFLSPETPVKLPRSPKGRGLQTGSHARTMASLQLSRNDRGSP
jgi:hypothetical protein